MFYIAIYGQPIQISVRVCVCLKMGSTPKRSMLADTKRKYHGV